MFRSILSSDQCVVQVTKLVKRDESQTSTLPNHSLIETQQTRVPTQPPNDELALRGKLQHSHAPERVMTQDGVSRRHSVPEGLGFRIWPRSTDVIFQIFEPPPSLRRHIQDQTTRTTLSLDFVLPQQVRCKSLVYER